jgi:hypothetical protein
VTVATSIRGVAATRYVTPFREGGSMPGLMEADDDGLYVVKFRGAGQGTLALTSEIVAAEIARAIGLPVPELVLVDVDPAIGVAEPDPEIQELITASPGVNLGVDFLPGALTYSPAAEWLPDAALAADIVWFDSLMTNVDRTAQNPNLLVWHDRLWLIDHGAAMYLQHAGLAPSEHAGKPFPQIGEHVLLPVAGSITQAGERLAQRIDPGLIAAAVELVPPEWLTGSDAATYVEYLTARLENSLTFSEEAERVRPRA